jgi:hypothetical protein
VTALTAALAVPAGPIGGAAARRAAQSELRRTEYHRDDASLLTRFFDWLGHHLGSVGGDGNIAPATLVVVILLVAVIIFALVRAGRPRRSTRAATVEDPLAAHDSLDHRRLAVDLEQQGRLAEAVREWLRATVRTIEDRGVLDPRPGRTGASVAREAGTAMPAIAADLSAAVDAFDAVWFGRRAPTPADVATARQAAEQVRTARIERSLDPGGYAVPR